MSANTSVPALLTSTSTALAIEADLEREILGAVDKAVVAVNGIKDATTYEMAAEYAKAVKGFDDAVRALLNPVCQERDRLHKEATTFRKKFTDLTEKALKIIKDGLEKFDDEQEAIRIAAEAAAQALVTKQTEEAVIDEAVELEKEGKVEEAEQILSQPLYVPTIVYPKATPKVSGVSSKPVYKWRLKKVGDISKVKPDYLTLNEKKINADVKNHGKKAESMVGGIEVYEERNYSISAKR